MPVVRPNSVETKQKAPDARVDEQIMAPGKYELSPDDVFEVDIYLRQVKGRWMLADVPGDGVAHEKATFRMWTYDERVEMRKKATTYDRIRRMHLIDNDALNRLKIQKFLKSWTFSDSNPRLRLHHVNGVLTDECWEMFAKRLHPAISIHIIEEMNKVYELVG